MRGLDPHIHLLGHPGKDPIVAKKRWTRGSSPRVTLWYKALNQTKIASWQPAAFALHHGEGSGSLNLSGPAFRRGGRAGRHRRDLGRSMHVAVPALGEGGGNV